MKLPKLHSLIYVFFTFFILFALVFPASSPVYAAGIAVEPLTWNIIGLDSNKPASGPNHFPVGTRVCNNTGGPISNVTADFKWENTTNSTYIYERPGTDTSITVFAPPEPTLANGDCADFYFEVEVLKDSAAYNKTRRYHIEVSSAETGAAVYSTPTPRELFVEHLVSQSRNAVTDVRYGTDLASLASVPAGGTMSLLVGQTYYIKLVGFTATQGYNQLESFINFPNTIFQVLSVDSVYSAPSAGYSIDKMYSDACGWDNVISSPTYRSCIVSDDKTGGDISVTYEVRILSVPGGAFTNPEPLSTLIYDFSGSSYHYNADFGISTRYAYVLDPASVDISKSFTPSTVAPDSFSTLTFTLTNSAPVTVSDVSFDDDLPSLSDGVTTGQMVVADPVTYSTSGCGAPTFSPTTGATSLSFSGGTIAPNGTCTVSVSVNVPDIPATGVYPNISDKVYVGGLDSGHNASADLTIDTAAITPGAGLCGQTLARWDFPSSFSTTSPGATEANVNASAAPGAGIAPTSSTQTYSGTTNSWGSNGAIAAGATLAIENNDYFEFAIDTTGYSSVELSFAARRTNNGPQSLTVYYGTSATLPGTSAYSMVSFLSAASTWFPSSVIGAPLLFSSGLNPTGETYFRIYAFNAGNSVPGSDIYIDDVIFTGCGEPIQPTLDKVFSPNPVVVGGASTLTFTIENLNTAQLTGLAFEDVLPAGVTVASNGPITVCGGSLTTTAPSTISFSGGMLASGASCDIPITVTATTAGPHTNISGFISSTEGGTNSGPGGSATASLTAVLPPTIEKGFNPNSILANETATLTFIITNPNPSDGLPNVAFSDSLPSGMTLAADVTTPQCGGTVTGAANTDIIGFSSGSVTAGGTCTVSVEVSASTLGDYVNSSDPVTTTIGGLTSGTDTTTATLSVEAPNPAISILKRVSTSATGPWSTFLTVVPGTNVHYQFTVENTGDVDLDNASVSDPTLTGLGLDLSSCVWVTLPRYSDAVTCVTTSTTALDGNNPNTATAQGTYTAGGTTETAISSASYVGVTAGVLNLSKQISTSPFGPWSSSIVDVAPGSTVYYRFTIVNATGEPLTSIHVTDVDPSIDPTVCSFTDPLLNNGATTCTIAATVSTTSVAKYTNTASAHGTDSGSNIVDSSPSSADYTPTAPDLVVNKTNDTGDLGVIGTPFTWTITVTNNGTGPGTFEAGDTILSDPLPAGALYGTLVIGGGIFGPIDCAINSGTLTCTANGAAVILPSGGSISVMFDATPTATGDLVNTATVDPGTSVMESEEGNNEASNTVSVLGAPSITKTFLDNPIAVGDTSTLRFTITNPSSSEDITGVAFSDTLPSGMTLAADVTSSQCGGTVTGTAGGDTVALSGGIVAASSSCTVDVSVTAAAGGSYLNTSGNVSSTNGGAGNTATATLNVFEAAKSIVSTSEASTGFVSGFERVVIGEGIRYRLTTLLPEGTWSNVQIADAIDTGIQFLNDGTATVSFVCNGACSNSNSPVTITGGPFGSSTDPSFDLGTVTNPDNDPDAEYLIIEFNALVLNMTSNVAGGLTRNNNYTVSVNGIPVTSPNVGVRIVEPSIFDFAKGVSPAVGPYYPGDTITYTLTYSNGSTGVNRATAFEVFVSDSLNANLNLQSVSVTTPAGSTATDTSTLGVAGAVRVLVDQVPPSADISSGPTGVTITVVAQLVSMTPSSTVPNTADLTYTSLPGGVTTGDSNGTCPNVTGSCTLGTSGDATGERNGTGVASNAYNDSTTLDITVTDRTPIANPDTNTATENGPAVNGNVRDGGVAAGDNPDDQGDPAAPVTDANQGGTPITIGSTFATTAGGSLTLNADGTYSYTPPSWNNVPAGGLTEVFNYTITDADGDTSSTSLTITVTDNDRRPVATDNSYNINEGGTASGNVMTDGVLDTLGDAPTTVTAYDATSANGGTVTVAADGSFSYDPNGYTGVDSFTYTITDVDGDTSTATVTITVNALPQANPDSTSTLMNAPVTTSNVLANDDLGDAPTTVTAFDASSTNGGTVTYNGNGTFDYNPPLGFTGTDTFIYTITDNTGDTSTATVTITVTNDPPIATNNAGAVDAGTPTHTANMLTDDEGSGVDSDPDGDPLTVTQIDGEINPAKNVPGTYGTLDWAADGSYTYTLNTSDPDYALLAGGATVTETYLYTISDGKGGTDTANIIITITGVDDVPVANEDSFTTPEDTSLNGDLKPDNGTGADIPSGDGGSIWTKVTDPAYGTVTVNLNGTFTYTPDADYNGPDLFTYQICDVDNDCDLATVNLTVTTVDDPSIGIAKRVADVTRVGSGTFDVTIELYVENYGDVALSNVQVTDDLAVTFPVPTTFTVQSVAISNQVSATLTANSGYNGSTDTNLLTGSGNALAVNGSGAITVVVSVLPSSSGPFNNSAFTSGETPSGVTVTDESSDGTDPDNTANCPACVNGDGNPANNTKVTEINFDPNIFDPPFGFKELDASGLPVLRWTMIWINDNNFPSVAAVSDPIPAGTTYEATGASSGYAIPGSAPVGSSNLGLSCTTDSAAEPAPGDVETITTLCYYEGPTGAYPRGRIVWEGLLGPDLGATDQANANDELYIRFNVRVGTGVTTAQNTATIDADLNNDSDMTDLGERVVATTRATWQEPVTPVDGQEGRRLPGTGFAPGKVTILPDQNSEQAYTDLGDLWLEIPSLGLKTPIVGVPKNAGVWDVDWLWEQAGWLQGTAFPSWQGNSVLTAHVYLPNGKPGPFVDLSKLRFGNRAIVHAFGQRYIYEIRTNHIVLPTDMSPFKHEEKTWLTLLTCKGYDEGTDTYKYRVEVRAVLLKIESDVSPQ